MSASPGQAPPVLVVDDEEGLRHLLRLLLERGGHEVLVAEDGEQGLAVLERRPDLRVVLCDIRMPRMDGMAFLDAVQARGLFVVMMSAFGTTDTAVEALSRGAHDYVSKPFRPGEVMRCIERIAEHIALEAENERLRNEGDTSQFVGSSQAAERVREMVRKVATFDSTVLVTGESGTGKELVAAAIHACSPRADRAFVAVNCGAIPDNLLEAQLFGHDKGAFTGAHKARAGVFEEAHRGTLFLDEIGEMPAQLQVGLLRVLESRVVRRLGSDRSTEIDVRVVAATSKDLDAAVEQGQFREDLYYRLNVVRLALPPLRERREDVPEIAGALLSRIARRLRQGRPRLSPDALVALKKHRWPGNVRELRNALEHAVVVCNGEVITPGDLPERVFRAGAGPAQGDFSTEGLSIKQNSARLERILISRALAETDGNKTQAAKMLEISTKALLYKMRDYGLEEA